MTGRTMRRGLPGLATLLLLAAPASAAAHVERPSYFPDPAPDRSVQPPAGGEVPEARSLGSALDEGRRGQTRVVCRAGSLRLLRSSVALAHQDGYEIRPSDERRLSAAEAERLLAINRRLKRMCEYHEVQAAVTDSGNNDRVVVMPGLYKEPTSRDAPTGDPDCDRYETNSDYPREPGALSFAYQFHCPNDQNLIAVIGHRPGKGEDPDPPRMDRNGIPNIGRCIRCNFQIEGSGVSADDVVIEAGRAGAGNGGPNGAGAAKDVAIRADRADGFVLRNMTVRHAGEHGIYVHETDGYLLDSFKVYYSRLYGTLTFTSDHGLTKRCDGAGHGDSAVYPGAAPETGEQRVEGTPFRYNQEIRRCDLHHNAAAYSGTSGNAVHFHHNNVYDNSLGITTDVVTAAGHPGFPADSALFEHNRIYSNNFNAYEEGSDVEAAFPFPVGTGMWIAGGNRHVVRNNRFWDNWRRGTMLFSVPDDITCGPQTGNEQAGCTPGAMSTSHYNSHYGNVMGIAPGGRADPNGVDFWWDSFPGSRGNCWYDNRGAAPIVTSPEPLPDCAGGTDPESSVGSGNPENEAELAACAASFETGNYDPATCPWFSTPPEPQPAEG